MIRIKNSMMTWTHCIRRFCSPVREHPCNFKRAELLQFFDPEGHLRVCLGLDMCLSAVRRPEKSRMGDKKIQVMHQLQNKSGFSYKMQWLPAIKTYDLHYSTYCRHIARLCPHAELKFVKRRTRESNYRENDGHTKQARRSAVRLLTFTDGTLEC